MPSDTDLQEPVSNRMPMHRWVSKRMMVVALCPFVLLLAGLALFGRELAPYDPDRAAIEARFLPPSQKHLFGTDDVGRDIFSRTIAGARLSLSAALLVLLLASGVGSALGLAAGFSGGWIDNLVMRTTELFLAFPALILAIAITAVLGPSLTNAVFAVAVVWWPEYSRLVRGQVLSVRQELFIEAARAMGLSEWRIATRHTLPHCAGVIIARASVDIGYAILLTATLGFLGLGVRPPSAEWGSMIALARPYLFAYWWTAFFPGLAIFVAVLILGLFGDAVHDAVMPR